MLKTNYDYDMLDLNSEWCFINTRSVEQWTHGYHRYPAKFVPNIVQKIMSEYTREYDTVADLFAGCGTTLVEAKMHGRHSVGIDINPVANLIARVKVTPIDPQLLQKEYAKLQSGIDSYQNHYSICVNNLSERIDYWFFPNDKNKISYLYDIINTINHNYIKDFFLVSLSHVLKNCSRWLQSSTKPQIDPNKKPADPFASFIQHSDKMIIKNEQFFGKLKQEQKLGIRSEILLEDARNTSIPTESVDAVITSPPYVTSYEYADIHQLTAYWFDYISDIKPFRRSFIGTFYSMNQELQVKSPVAQDIVNRLYEKNKRMAKEIAGYFKDMDLVCAEMYRILKNEGYACIVIGNVTLRGIKIRAAEIISEYLVAKGFRLTETIKRSVPNKLIPTIRDKKTGRFAKIDNNSSKLVYPDEYIIFARK